VTSRVPVQDGFSWLLAPPEESLAYILADDGFDVWIANNRGTRWSRRHVSLDPSSRVT
jgi:lysosomal acid lipase/cholesteryl ester hydrolase